MAELVRYQTMVFDSGRWDGFELRDDDIVICTPPKCGTTWTQMICERLDACAAPDLAQWLQESGGW
jgi:hypothetical protein